MSAEVPVAIGPVLAVVVDEEEEEGRTVAEERRVFVDFDKVPNNTFFISLFSIDNSVKKNSYL